MSNTQDEKIKRSKEIKMRHAMENLESQFGYREYPKQRKPNIIKQAEEIFGVRLSIQYKKALEGKIDEVGSSLVEV